MKQKKSVLALDIYNDQMIVTVNGELNIYLAHSYCHRAHSYCHLAYWKWAMDAYAYACRRCPAADWRPFVGQAIGSVGVAMAVLAAMRKAGLAVMDSIVDFDSAVVIAPIASIAVALKSIAVSAVPLHLVGCVAFDSYLNSPNKSRLVNANRHKFSMFKIHIAFETYRIVVAHYRCCRRPAGMAFSFVANAANTAVDSFPAAAFAFAVAADDASSFDFSAIAARGEMGYSLENCNFE